MAETFPLTAGFLCLLCLVNPALVVMVPGSSGADALLAGHMEEGAGFAVLVVEVARLQPTDSVPGSIWVNPGQVCICGGLTHIIMILESTLRAIEGRLPHIIN